MDQPLERFRDMVREVTGLELEDAMILAEEQERLELDRIRAAGYCCRAGLVGHPDPCPWHGEP